MAYSLRLMRTASRAFSVAGGVAFSSTEWKSPHVQWRQDWPIRFVTTPPQAPQPPKTGKLLPSVIYRYIFAFVPLAHMDQAEEVSVDDDQNFVPYVPYGTICYSEKADAETGLPVSLILEYRNLIGMQEHLKTVFDDYVRTRDEVARWANLQKSYNAALKAQNVYEIQLLQRTLSDFTAADRDALEEKRKSLKLAFTSRDVAVAGKIKKFISQHEKKVVAHWLGSSNFTGAANSQATFKDLEKRALILSKNRESIDGTGVLLFLLMIVSWPIYGGVTIPFLAPLSAPLSCGYACSWLYCKRAEAVGDEVKTRNAIISFIFGTIGSVVSVFWLLFWR